MINKFTKTMHQLIAPKMPAARFQLWQGTIVIWIVTGVGVWALLRQEETKHILFLGGAMAILVYISIAMAVRLFRGGNQ